MSTKQEVQSVGLTELALLEAAFNEELRCESLSHRSYCTFTVVAVAVMCCAGAPNRFWCQARVEQFYREHMKCAHCGELSEHCWEIIPI